MRGAALVLAILLLAVNAMLTGTFPAITSASQERPDLPPLPLPIPRLTTIRLNLDAHTAVDLDAFWYLLAGLSGLYFPAYVPREDRMSIETLLPEYRFPGLSDVFRLDTGAALDYSERLDYLNIQGTTIYPSGENVEIKFKTGRAPRQYPTDYKISYDLRLSFGGSRCGWCRAIWKWLSGRPAQAQPVNHFAGPGFQEDVILFARLEGPGRASLRARTSAGERTVPGTVEVEDDAVGITVRFATLAELGVARPGVRVILGVVGSGQNAFFDRVPDQGSIQMGVSAQGRGVEVRIVARFDLDNDGRADLFYLDTNGNGQIDAAGRDYNRDGQVEFSRAEGPFLYLAPDGRPQEFPRVDQRTTGRRQTFLLQNAQMAHLTIAEDKNGDGRIGPGEFAGYYLPKR